MMTQRATLNESTATAKPEGTAGRMLVQLITPGKGSSGVYSAAVLEQAARDRVWPAGTHMYADHPSRIEDADRPERSVRDIAGVLLEDARWDADAQALVAEAQTVGPLGEAMLALKDAIGVSIRASAEIEEGQYEGKRARLVTRLVEGQSVDFVTRAGRGGKVLQLLESATAAIEEDLTEIVAEAGSASLSSMSYVPTATTSGQTFTAALTVPAATPSVPVVPAVDSHKVQENHMTDIEEGLRVQLDEAAGRATAAEADRDAARTELTQLRVREAARPIVAAALAESAILDADDKASLAESLVESAKATDAGTLDETALKASAAALVAAEEARVGRYLTAAGVGMPRGFGDTNPVDIKPVELTEAAVTDTVLSKLHRSAPITKVVA